MRTALAFTIFLLVLAVPALAAAPAQTVLTTVRGDVTVKPSGGAWSKAAEGMALAGGDSVKTGPAAKAEIAFPSGAMRLFENTLVVIPSAARAELDGSAVFRIDPKVAGGFSVKTRHVIAGVKGTKFGVTAGPDSTEVVVYYGLVEVTDLSGGKGVMVGTNQTSTSGPAGPGAPQGAPTGDGWGGWFEGAGTQSTDPASESQGGEGDGNDGGGKGGNDVIGAEGGGR